MGHKTAFPPPIGNSCALCDGILWPVAQTPTFIRLEFRGVTKCPACPYDAPDGDYILVQDTGDACLYVLNIGDVAFFVAFEDGATIFSVSADDGVTDWQMFIGQVGTCGNAASNIVLTCGGNRGARGGVVLFNLL